MSFFNVSPERAHKSRHAVTEGPEYKYNWRSLNVTSSRLCFSFFARQRGDKQRLPATGRPAEERRRRVEVILQARQRAQPKCSQFVAHNWLRGT